MRPDVDVLVVGGGPVGLACAIEARLRGLTAAIVEPREGAIDKACGEGLMPGAVPALERLGVRPPGHPLRGVSYRDASRTVEHRFTAGSGLGVRRTVLHAALLVRAVEVGVDVLHARVTAINQDANGVEAAGLRARYLIGADGLHSTVRTLLGVDVASSGPRRYGLRRHFSVEPWTDLIEVHWTPRLEAYVTPLGDGMVGVAMLGARGTNFEEELAAIPALAARIGSAAPASSLRGAGPFRQRSSRRRVGRVMLAGDSSGYVDAITGEGIRVGLAQARAAIDCVAADDASGYERAWSKCTRDFRLLTSGLVALAGSPLRPAIVPLADALPGVFGAVVERLGR
ncbi:NAD(P)/FAD-dependent oxidoreductase [Parafrigoribacterium soli]|uniref:NAD(P)/FAD-dependent oxidoreductase n=1 Tax=Parafrigoribacterium soli TaxID=3144663 RepID=UPI0032EDEF95